MLQRPLFDHLFLRRDLGRPGKTSIKKSLTSLPPSLGCNMPGKPHLSRPLTEPLRHAECHAQWINLQPRVKTVENI
jgi:hypothetical protein